MNWSYQQLRQLEGQQAGPQHYQLATVTSVYSDGVKLQFDGETMPRPQRYPCNASVSFAVGQRVKVEKVGGTYIAAYPIKGG